MAAPSRSVPLDQTSSDSPRGTRRKRSNNESSSTTKKSNNTALGSVEEANNIPPDLLLVPSDSDVAQASSSAKGRSSRSKRQPRAKAAQSSTCNPRSGGSSRSQAEKSSRSGALNSKGDCDRPQASSSISAPVSSPYVTSDSADKATRTERSKTDIISVPPVKSEGATALSDGKNSKPGILIPPEESEVIVTRSSTRKRTVADKQEQPPQKRGRGSATNNPPKGADKDQEGTTTKLKTGGRVSRSRSGRGGGASDSTTGSCTSTSRGRRSSRARPEPAAMATRESDAGSQQRTEEPPARLEEPAAPQSALADADSSPIEDAEMTRLQALLEARGLPAHLFGSLGPRMHLLLHRTFSSSAGSKAQQLLTNMQSEDEGQQLQAVMEMCQLLVMGNEETLSGFPVKQAVPVLITLLQMDHNFDIMNHACRALTYLMEALPRSSAVVVDATATFLEKVQIIQCMDVAEQSLTALEMLSRRHGKAILQAGGMNSCLLYLDFFSIVAQRSALAIAANCCHAITAEEFSHAKEAVPILSSRLPNQDKKSVESVCLAFARLVDNFQKDAKLLEAMAAHGLLENLQQLLVISPPLISTGTFVMVIRMLAVMCGSCPSIAVRLLNQNIAEAVKCLLVGVTSNDTPEDIPGNVELVSRNPQELYEIMCLISELLPPLPTTGVFSVDALLHKGLQGDMQLGCWQWRDDRNTWHNYMWVDSKILEAAFQSNEEEISMSTLGRNYIIDFTNMQQINEDTGTTRPIQRKATPGQSNPTAPNTSSASKSPVHDQRLEVFDSIEIGLSFVESLFGIVYVVYYSSVGPAVKHKCLNAILKMLYHTPSPQLALVLSKASVSSYVAGMMSSQDLRIICCALQKAEILMTKLPDVFHVCFRREGVMHKVEMLAAGLVTPFSTPTSKGDVKPDADGAATPSASTSALNKGSESFDSLATEQPSEESGKAVDVVKRKRITRRLSRGKSAKASSQSSLSTTPPAGIAAGTPPPASKMSTESLKARTSLLSSSPASASPGNSQSFLSSFRPRWGRSHSYSCATPSTSEKTVRDNFAKQQELTRQKVKEWIAQQASSFFNQYFGEAAGDAHPALNILRQLSSAVNDLSSMRNDGSAALKEMRSILQCAEEQNASAFEILHSGVVQQLLSYLTSESDYPLCNRQLRLKHFLHTFLGCPDPNSASVGSPSLPATPPLIQLVRKLNLCINQLEQLPVKCHDLPTGSGVSTRGSSVLRFFNKHQIKCNLQRHSDCNSLRRWKGGPVKIDPLALTQAIERYLVVRGYGRSSQHPDDDDSDDDDRSDDEIDESWASQLQSANNPKHFLEFTLNGHPLPYNMTVYQAVRQYGKTNYNDERDVEDDDGPFGRATIWSDTHTILYRPVTQTVDKRTPEKSKKTKTPSPRAVTRATKSPDQAKLDATLALSSAALATMTTTDPSLEVISLLRVIHHLNSHWGHLYEALLSSPAISSAEFVNSKLTSKAMRQLQDPLVIMTNSLPSWLSELAQACPFLFPFECRLQLFYTVTFDRERAMMRLQENVPDVTHTDTSDRVTPRLEKKKRTVSRSNLFKQAETVIGDMAASKALLEIQYEGEVGTGLGPTLEFYTLVSLEFQKASLEMWRGDVMESMEDGADAKERVKYYHSTCGLFPAPIGKSTKGSVLTRLKARFRFLGKFVAKALMDSRMLDVPFSRAFYKWMLHEEATMELSDLQWVDAALFKSLSQLNDVVLKKKRVERESDKLSLDDLHKTLSDITLDGLPIEELALDFVLPGDSNIELKKNGRDAAVTVFNLEEYIKLVVHWTLVEGVSKQMHAFREGFIAVFPLASLGMFDSAELDMLLCGSRTEKWDVKDLTEACRSDHGFNQDSNAIRILFDLLSKYDGEEQRRFLQFVTGSPRLPVGGFRSLKPPLTIVRKTVEAPANPDSYLPSVMTCVNYLKLPDYSSIEVMSEKLKTAYLEGKNAFHLS